MKKILSQLRQNIFVQGGILLMVVNVITGLMNYVFNVLVGRLLGPEGYAEIAATFSYMVILSIPVGIVITLLIQKIGEAEKPLEYSASIYEWLREICRTYWFLFLIPMIFIPFMPWVTNVTPFAAYIIIPIVMPSAATAFYDGVYQGLHLFWRYSISNIMSTILRLMGAALLYVRKELAIVLGFISLATIFRFIFFHVLLNKKYKELGKNIIPKKITFSKLLKDKQLWYTSILTATLGLINNVDIIAVKKLFDAEQAGYYSAWAQYAKIILYLLAPLVSILYIFFSNNKQRIYHQIVFITSFLVLIAIGVATNLGYGFYGKKLIFMLFGKEFYPINTYLEWAAYYGTGYVMMMVMSFYFLARKSIISLVPALLLPLYVVALIVYPNNIADVMYLNIIYVFLSITIFLLAFFKDRVIFLLK